MIRNFEQTLQRYERAIPFILFLLFIFITVPGIDWGAPALWNPDEVVWRVIKALDGELIFDETEPDYNYPSLPKYVMYGVGLLARKLGGDETQVLISIRLVSVLLGGLTVILTYYLAKLLSHNIYVRLLSAFFVISNMILAHNGRFAHNDLYLLFFITLSLFALVKYRLSRNRLWIYLAFFSVGCATSSKYTGASFALVVALVFLLENWRTLFTDWLQNLELVALGVLLTVLGYGVGTPKFLLWMSYYLKRMVPAAFLNASYGRGSDSLPGVFGQWAVFRDGVGPLVYYVFIVAFLWYAYRLIQRAARQEKTDEDKYKSIVVILASILIFNIPFLFSYNYQSRFFLPFIPMLSILAGLFMEDMIYYARNREYYLVVPAIWVLSAIVILSSFVSVISVALLFKNDARMPASIFIKTLPANTHIEYTLYPPQVDGNQFEVARNYPIYLVKYLGEEVPANKPYKYNLGEDGLYLREADYFVADSFTYVRFTDDYICQTNPVECDFFTRLLAGETSLELLAEFEYSLPPYLPQISISSVNPVVKIYKVPR